jgi:hypothetical protein
LALRDRSLRRGSVDRVARSPTTRGKTDVPRDTTAFRNAEKSRWNLTLGDFSNALTLVVGCAPASSPIVHDGWLQFTTNKLAILAERCRACLTLSFNTGLRDVTNATFARSVKNVTAVLNHRLESVVAIRTPDLSAPALVFTTAHDYTYTQTVEQREKLAQSTMSRRTVC